VLSLFAKVISNSVSLKMSLSFPHAFDVQGRQRISQLWFLAQDMKLILLKLNFVDL
jgi:hypothetical protein